MGNRKDRELGSHEVVEGRHGDATHARFIEQLQEKAGDATVESPDATRAAEAKGRPVVGHHRQHEDREQHDEAEKNSEKSRAEHEARRRGTDENVIAHARVPHEGDSH